MNVVEAPLDEFCIRFDLPKTNAMTKRNIFSIIARLALGLLEPVHREKNGTIPV